MYCTPRCDQKETSAKTGKPKKAELYQMAEKLENSCHIPDLVQAFYEENSGLNLKLRCSKPPTWMTVV